MKFFGKAQCAIFTFVILVACPYTTAKDPIRIWVDATGRYSVEAALRMIKEDRVILVRRDGGQASLMIDQLSVADKEYVDEYRKQNVKASELQRELPPEPPSTQPLERLDLPYAAFTAPEGSPLVIGTAKRKARVTWQPKELLADPSPDQIQFSETNIPIARVKSYDTCSRVVQVGSQGSPALAVSISSGFHAASPGAATSRFMMFSPSTQSSEIVYRGDKPATILDHNPHSGRSLVLTDHSPLGHGGSLAIASGWNRQQVKLDMLRVLPKTNEFSGEPHLRWARWLDEDSFIAVVDESLIGWNLTSGEPLFRIDGIDRKSMPAISGGRRYVAVPDQGSVYLYDTTDGSPLGRIDVEANAMAGVGFSKYGHALAISTSRRLRIWDLATAALSDDIESRRSLGLGAPVWIDSDLVMSSSGVLISLFRGLPVWRYEISGSEVQPIGNRIVLFRKYPRSALVALKMPHTSVEQAIEWIDSIPKIENLQTWQIPGRSVWDKSNWIDRDVRLSRKPVQLR